MNVTNFERKKRKLRFLTKEIQSKICRKGKKMGLAAGQARLLSITGRKSDCEFESMRLSHQKIALARELADLSNEYQNSLNQTKLVYDYYGTGDTSTQLSYGILMNPSALNNYMPTMITDPLGRAVLNSKYAAAARDAGIPQEGLGSLPSEDTRNAFIQALCKQGLITEKLATTITGLPYNQAAGLGGGTTVAINTKEVDLEGLEEYLGDISVDLKDIVDKNHGGQDSIGGGIYKWNGNGWEEIDITKESISLKDLIEGNIAMWGTNPDNEDLRGNDGKYDYTWEERLANSSLWETLQESFADLFDLGDGYTAKALEYANNRLSEMLTPRTLSVEPDNYGYMNTHSGKSCGKIEKWIKSESFNYVGKVNERNSGSNYNDGIGMNLSYAVKSYLTWIADFMNGLSKCDQYGVDKYHADVGGVQECRFVTDDSNFLYTIKTGSEVSSDDLGQSTFYDALFNQICLNGWTENDNVTNNEYLQQMLQSGMMFISKMKDDNYYYQGNYATDTYIKEIADETKVAYAESKYNTEKAKLNAKEETLDLKMKNLDTEISSLTTEYDTVKNTISKNIEKSFKRYSA